MRWLKKNILLVSFVLSLSVESSKTQSSLAVAVLGE